MCVPVHIYGLCMHAHVHVCAYACVCTCWRPEVNPGYLFLFILLFFFWDSLSLSLPVLDRVACLQIIQGLPVSGSPPLGFQTCTVMSNIYMSGGLWTQVGSHASSSKLFTYWESHLHGPQCYILSSQHLSFLLMCDRASGTALPVEKDSLWGWSFN